MDDLDQAQKEMEEEKKEPVSAEVQAARDKKRKELQEEKDKRDVFMEAKIAEHEKKQGKLPDLPGDDDVFSVNSLAPFFISTLSSFSCLRLLETLISSGLLDKGGCEASGKAYAGPSPTLSTCLAVILPHRHR